MMSIEEKFKMKEMYSKRLYTIQPNHSGQVRRCDDPFRNNGGGPLWCERDKDESIRSLGILGSNVWPAPLFFLRGCRSAATLDDSFLWGSLSP
jgi:hypothetical protein